MSDPNSLLSTALLICLQHNITELDCLPDHVRYNIVLESLCKTALPKEQGNIILAFIHRSFRKLHNSDPQTIGDMLLAVQHSTAELSIIGEHGAEFTAHSTLRWAKAHLQSLQNVSQHLDPNTPLSSKKVISKWFKQLCATFKQAQ